MMLLIVLGFVASASACCMPDKWSGNMGLQYAMWNDATQNGTYAEGSVEIAFDNTRRIIAENQLLNVDNRVVRQRIVMDFSQKTSFVIREDGSCTKHMLGDWISMCLTDDSNTKNVNYGLGGNFVNAKYYEYKMGMSDIYMTVTADTCVPLAEDVITRIGDVKIMSVMGFSDIKASIPDPMAFFVPVACTANLPLLPALPGTGGMSRRSLPLY